MTPERDAVLVGEWEEFKTMMAHVCSYVDQVDAWHLGALFSAQHFPRKIPLHSDALSLGRFLARRCFFGFGRHELCEPDFDPPPGRFLACKDLRIGKLPSERN